MNPMVLDPFDPSINGGESAVVFPRLVDSAGLPVRHGQWLAAVTARAPEGASWTTGGCAACRGFVTDGRVDIPVGPFVLAPRDLGMQSIEIHTLRFGNPPWMKECAPTLDDWCSRHGLPLVITDSWDPSYPDPKFCEIDMLRRFLAGDSEWMIYVDADVVVHPLAPRPFFSQPGFHIRSDRYNFIPSKRRSWADWCLKRFGYSPPDSWVYRNAGVWACDRASARAMLDVISAPYHSGIMEQHHWNWWLCLANRNGMPVVDLGKEWNRIPEELEPAWFFHIYAKDKFGNLLKFRRAGLLPDAVKRVDSAPRVPDFGKGAVVWPWKSSAAEWDELWYSHRSVIRHWSERDWPLVLFADHKPSWWPGEYVACRSYEDALWMGVQCAENVLWMNDDIFMLAAQSPDDLREARHLGDMTKVLGKQMVARNDWRRGLGQVLMRCHHHGRSVLNFSTHTPYLYQRDRAREILDTFGVFYKIPFETAYHNWHASPHRPCAEKSAGPHDLAGKLWINPSFRQVTRAFRAEIEARFGRPPG